MFDSYDVYDEGGMAVFLFSTPSRVAALTYARGYAVLHGKAGVYGFRRGRGAGTRVAIFRWGWRVV